MQVRPYQSLYVHVPFCAAKCAYCAFYSKIPQSSEIQNYLSRLEIEFAQKQAQCQELRSIFIGGGTPSILDAAQLQSLFSLIRKYFRLIDDCEFSMEANPDSLTVDKLQAAKAHGLNRLSLGVQSFNPKIRETIGRQGKLDRLEEILSAAQAMQLHDINFDLIYNIPGQSLQDWQNDLRRACAYAPTHLSAYALILEEKSALASKFNQENDEQYFEAFWQSCDEILSEYGFSRYEIANFAKPSYQCRHNQEVWHGQTYLGCGPAAASFDGMNRCSNPANLENWLQGAKPEIDQISPEARAREILAFAMRTCAGWNKEEFTALTGYTAEELRKDEIEHLTGLGLIINNDKYMYPTPKGLLFNDYILEMMI
ncbi:MAG: radical SAM family heme chaperone HemW [Oligosphaeraceae bacterium]|nr:radical SAM family heme chaperone HemW [Oligosphaeraceae bacterium]